MDKHFQKMADCLQDQVKHEQWLEERFNEIKEAGAPYVLVCVNIKNFKYLNLNYGWEQGNEILQLVYLAMESQLAEDEYIAYSSADNYVLLLHSELKSTAEEAKIEFTKNTIIRFIDAIFEINDDRIYKNIYASFGIYPILSSSSYNEAVELADFFRKEEEGIKLRSFSVEFYADEAFQLLLQKHELRKSTANALQKGEYQVYIQPKVDTKTFKIVGGEALLRRFDGDGKAVPLYEFLPILNEEGYIWMVDWFVFETVCQQISDRIAEEKTIVPLSFNISKSFFYNEFMCDNYISTYQKYDIPQEYIEFELMESISLNDTDHMVKVIKQLKQAGFKCSLDDFGNGYSSFGVLLNADVDYIKLDRIFFIKPLDDTVRMMLKSIVDMLKFLGFKIVAEGVETKEYVDYLAELGCDMIQGYYFYRPMPLEEFVRLLDEQVERGIYA